MSDKINVKFKEAGKWADNPSDPIFEVKADEVVAVSANLANILSKSGKGQIVKEKVLAEEDKSPKQGDECQFSKNKKGVINENGKCVKKAY